MLDDDNGGGERWIEFGHRLIGGVGVVDVVVGKLLALHLPGRRDAGALFGRAIEGCRLVRIFAVAQNFRDRAAERPEGRRRVVELGRKPVGDGRIVGRRARIGFLREPKPQGARDGPLISRHVVENRRVIGPVHHHRHVGVVFCGGADHRGAADIDIFHAIVIRTRSRDGRLERIEIDHQKIDLGDAVRQHCGLMFRVGADSKEAPMDRRMKRLDASVHHLGKAREIAHIADREPRFSQCLLGSAGGNKLDSPRRERPGEIHKTGLVGHGQKSAGDALEVARHGLLRWGIAARDSIGTP